MYVCVYERNDIIVSGELFLLLLLLKTGRERNEKIIMIIIKKSESMIALVSMRIACVDMTYT